MSRQSSNSLLSPLHSAVLAQDLFKVIELLHQPDVNVEAQVSIIGFKSSILYQDLCTTELHPGDTALHIAVRYKLHEIVVSLTSAAPSLLNIPNRYSNLPIHIAAFKGYSKLISYLIDDDNADKVNSAGNTALHLAATYNHPETARILIDLGAALDPVGSTYGALLPMCKVSPLHKAVFNRYTGIVRILLQSGANPNVFKNDTTTCILLHHTYCSSDYLDDPQLSEIIKLLIMYDVEIPPQISDCHELSRNATKIDKIIQALDNDNQSTGYYLGGSLGTLTNESRTILSLRVLHKLCKKTKEEFKVFLDKLGSIIIPPYNLEMDFLYIIIIANNLVSLKPFTASVPDKFCDGTGRIQLNVMRDITDIAITIVKTYGIGLDFNNNKQDNQDTLFAIEGSEYVKSAIIHLCRFIDESKSKMIIKLESIELAIARSLYGQDHPYEVSVLSAEYRQAVGEFDQLTERQVKENLTDCEVKLARQAIKSSFKENITLARPDVSSSLLQTCLSSLKFYGNYPECRSPGGTLKLASTDVRWLDPKITALDLAVLVQPSLYKSITELKKLASFSCEFRRLVTDFCSNHDSIKHSPVLSELAENFLSCSAADQSEQIDLAGTA